MTQKNPVQRTQDSINDVWSGDSENLAPQNAMLEYIDAVVRQNTQHWPDQGTDPDTGEPIQWEVDAYGVPVDMTNSQKAKTYLEAERERMKRIRWRYRGDKEIVNSREELEEEESLEPDPPPIEEA